VLLLGHISGAIEKSFNQFWSHPLSISVDQIVEKEGSKEIGSSSFQKLHNYACNPDNFWPQVRDKIANLRVTFDSIQVSENFMWLDSVSYVSDMPGKNDGKNGLGGGGICTDALINLIKQAKSTIEIQSPYLITTKLGQGLLKDAVSRGVKVRILTNSLSSTDNLEAFSGYQRDRKKILELGVKIYEFRPDAAERYKMMTGALQEKINYVPIFGLHAKSMVVDGKITVIGTFNLDPRSANLNTECVTIINSEKLASNVLKGMEEEFKPENAWEVTLDSNPDSEAGIKKRVKTWTRKIIPKDIL
jgi:phosphatidylserine/phosphatidylglycerophosphate/cardiolipin synthase-like enzyme